MLSKLEIEFENMSEIQFSRNMASLFHGFLMEQLDFAYGEVLHCSALKPFSQYLLPGKEKCKWIVSSLNGEAHEKIVKTLAEEKLESIYLRQRDLKIKISAKKEDRFSYDELIRQTILQEHSRYLVIHFLTPTAFKSQGSYLNYPTVKNIFYSLSHKFDTVCTKLEIGSDQVLQDMESHVSICQYHLNSTCFSIEGVHIPAFFGEITLHIEGPQQLVGLVYLLVQFGEYSGVGIKTALGMGAIKAEEKEQQNAGETV